jgi:DNA polymerase (family 10)
MSLKNHDISSIFNSIAKYLSIKGDNPFRIRAYQNAAENIEHLPFDLFTYYSNKKKLPLISGVGDDLSGKIIELIQTGKLSFFEKLKDEFPISLIELMDISGLGPVKVRKLLKELKIISLEELKKKAINHQIQKLYGFGIKSEENILKSISLFENAAKQFLWSDVNSFSSSLIRYLKDHVSDLAVEATGSLRRSKDFVGDLDLLASCIHPKLLMDCLKNHPEANSVLLSGPNRTTVLFQNGIQVDLKLVPLESYGSALVYFTGSKSHNIALRKIAIENKMQLNEYGILKNNHKLVCKTESDVYGYLGLQWIPPELREGSDEIAKAQSYKIPKLIEISDIRGDLHVHSEESDGENSIIEIANAAKSLGYEYVAITDHSKSLKIANGLNEKRYLEQFHLIDQLNQKLAPFHIFKGGEVSVLEDGSLDVSSRVLSEMEVVVIGIHDHFRLSRSSQTKRILKAIEFPGPKILGHPTGRLYGRRSEIDVDFEEVVRGALENNCFFELNCQPSRMDLNDLKCKYVVHHGLGLSISTDSHRNSELDLMNFGVRYAKRGWVEPLHVLNARSISEISKIFQK